MRPISEHDDLAPAELARYGRHLSLPEVGREGQLRLKRGSALLVGAGGLGAPAAMYLAAAGIGRLGIVDFDVVDTSNLHRQILHGTADVGRPKGAAAMDRLHELNPHVELVPHEVRLTRDNALALLGEYDVIVDGTDNFPTRYLVNDACVLLGKPNVHGAIYRFDGQASVFAVKGRACYRCLHPVPPRPEDAPSCAEAGVLGVLPGLIGAIQATETLKLLLGGGDTLVDRLLVVDAWRMRFRELRLRRDPACPVCGDAPTVRALVDYEAFCAGPAATPSASPEISARELASRLALGHDLLLLDVREPHEHALARLPGSVLVPLGALASRVAELAPTREVVLFCKEGGRSARGLRLLREAGFGGKMLSLKGGLSAWRAEVDPELPRY